MSPRILHLLIGLAAVAPAPAIAQGASGDAGFPGRWEGTLPIATRLRIALEIVKDPSSGALRASLVSIDQGNQAIPATLAISRDTARLSAMNGALELVQVMIARDTLRGELRQGGAVLPLTMVRTVAPPPPARPQAPRPPFPYTSEEITVESAPGVRLAGTITVPAGPGPFPAVVLVSGSGPQDRDESLMGHKPFLVLADHLSRHGIAVLRYDDRGVARSTGSFATATSADFAVDAAAAVAALRRHARVAAAKVGIIGHSEGGLVAPIVAAGDPAVAFLVLLGAPGIRIDSLMLLQSRRLQEVSGVPPAAMTWNLDLMRSVYGVLRSAGDSAAVTVALTDTVRAALGRLPEAARATVSELPLLAEMRTLTSPWYRWFIRHDPGPVLSRVSVPILAINGALDVQVTASENLAGIAAAARHARNDQVRIVEMPGLNHLLQTATTGGPGEYATIEETMAPAVLVLITQWIQERTR